MAHVHDGEGELPTTIGRTFAIGIALNVGFVIIEALYGWRAGSLALLADAFHNLSDVGGLLLAWAGLAAGRLASNDRHTYGWRRGSILASFANAVLLLVAMGSLAWEAAHRVRTPVAIDGWTVMVVAAIGVVVNATTAALFYQGRKGDLNIRAAFLHMAADALVSAGRGGGRRDLLVAGVGMGRSSGEPHRRHHRCCRHLVLVQGLPASPVRRCPARD